MLIACVVLGSATASAATPTKPSSKATMVCAPEARRDIAGVLATKPLTVTKPTWQNRVYSCTYRYVTGSFTVSVKQLTDRPATINYFHQVGQTMNRLPDNIPMGDSAFQTANGSTVVRKDNNVLAVDASALPTQFSKLKLAPADVTAAVAMTILGCWKG
jgi:hypothetical protein